MPKMYKKFTATQEAIIQAYNGNARQTAKKCGCSPTYVADIVRRPDMVEAIRKRNNTATGTHICNREQLQGFWSQVLMDQNVSMPDRLRASELLGRSDAQFTDKTLTGSLDKELETMSEDDIKARVKSNLELIEGKRNGTDG